MKREKTSAGGGFELETSERKVDGNRTANTKTSAQRFSLLCRRRKHVNHWFKRLSDVEHDWIYQCVNSLNATMCILEASFLNKKFSRKVVQAIIVVLAGVAVATVSDVEMNIAGTIAASVGVLSTSPANIGWALTKETQRGQ